MVFTSRLISKSTTPAITRPFTRRCVYTRLAYTRRVMRVKNAWRVAWRGV